MKLSKILTATSLAVVLALSAGSLMAQDNNGERQGRRNRDAGPGGPGNFDPAEMQARMMERTKETLEITDDTEWKAIEPLVVKVMEARRDTMGGIGRGFRGGRGGGDNNDRGPRGGMFGGTPSPEAEALQRAIDGKASNSEIKAALAKYEAARKAKQAALEKAQADLRKVLTPRQEAIAAMNGLL
jgi:Spy/CpxP family protein refolding chaperone